MATRSHPLSIVDAVETLSSIADLEFDRDFGITQKHEVILGHEKVTYKTVHWLHEQDALSTINLVRETFRVILHYLTQFYRHEYGQVTDQNTLEEMRAMMVLVGEAATKLDKFTQFFHQTQKVVDLKEYQQLQEFYRTKIARKLDKGISNQWIVGLSLLGKGEKTLKVPPQTTGELAKTKNVFVDFETVKKDEEYELFFIRKEDGSRFFSSRLLRNIKLVCDFGDYFGERKELDPLESIKQWYDRTVHGCARELMKSLGQRLNNFFHATHEIKDYEFVQILNKALLALMLSSYSQNLLHHHPIKSCTEYFEDFQSFLREALQNPLYQKWMLHPPKEDNHLATDLFHFTHTLCRFLYTQLQGLEEIKPIIQELIEEAHSLSREQAEKMGSPKIWHRLTGDYQALSKLLKHHTNGPLFKILEMLKEGKCNAFDPILQYNIPNRLYDLYGQDKHYTFLRFPAPIYQEYINRAMINEEFRGFLRSYAQGPIPKKHLFINLEDRTSWREYVRCIVLEKLQQEPEIENAIDVVTLAKDTDFYHQLVPYHELSHAHLFKEQFKELLLDEKAGYFFPPKIQKEELIAFIDQAFDSIHHIFFSSKNVLLRENRLDFIEIFYWLLQLKLIEWLQPDTISLTSKDSIDVGEADSAAIFAFIKLIHDEEWSEDDWGYLNFMLYAPALLMRERLILPERFNRMVIALKSIENARYELGSKNFRTMIDKEISTLFKTPLLQSQVLLPL